MKSEESIKLPRLVMHLDLVGTDSLVGKLTEEFIKRDCVQYVGLLKIEPVEIVFVIKKVHKEINLYKEINKVRDIFKIDEKNIIIFML